MECPEESLILRHAEGTLPPDEDARIRQHVTGCDACLQMVAVLVKSDTPTRPDFQTAGLTEQDVIPGHRIGRYVVEELIGSGGMGLVYRARDVELDRPVALKFLKQTFPGERLLREAQAMARLSHPNVVTVYESGTVGQSVYVAMEFVEGQTLTAWIAEEPRPWRAVVRAYLEAGRGLAAAHGAGVVHRDFKPDNVLVGNDGRVRVTDFGLARALRDDVTGKSFNPAAPLTTKMTLPGVVVGTPAYMAPEMWLGRRADAASDQFSFCVALYEGLYGNRPFPTRSDGGSSETLPELPAPPGGRKEPARLRRLLRRGLDADPANRYPSMEALLDELADLSAVSAPSKVAAWALAVMVLGLAGVLVYRGARTDVTVATPAPVPAPVPVPASVPAPTPAPAPAPAPEAVPVPVVAAPSPPLAKPAIGPKRESPSRASVDLQLSPPALVFIGGTQVCDRSTHCRLRNQPIGDLHFEVADPKGAFSKAASVSLKAGDNGVKQVTVEQSRLEFRVHPYAWVTLDGKALGQTPFPGVPAYEGRHRVRLVNEELHQDFTVEVVVKPGQATLVKYDLNEPARP